MTWDDDEVRAHVRRIETLLSALEDLPHETARTRATDTVGALVDLYGECLTRIMARVAAAGAGAADAGGDLAEALAADELVGHLLLVHDLHPLPAAERIRRALADTEPALRTQGGEAELLDAADGVARIRLRTEGGGCGSSSGALASAVEQVVRRAAPEIEDVEISRESPARQTLIPVDALLAGPPAADSGRAPRAGAG